MSGCQPVTPEIGADDLLFGSSLSPALLDAEMGLGEYTYIFVLGNSPHLVSSREDEGGVVIEDV